MLLSPTAPLPPSIRVGGVHPLRFGKNGKRFTDIAKRMPSLSNEAKLFATTYAAGFVAVSLFIA